jgi:hypothetical protein
MRGQMTHLDADVLAEFRAGLITGRRGGKIAAHLAGCDRCTALDDKLAGVCSLLASVPAPAMPDSVARRLDMALAAEVADSRDHPERSGRDVPRETGAHGRRSGHRGFRPLTLRVLAPAAAVVVLAAGGYGLSRIVAGPGSQQALSSAGSAQNSSARHAANSTSGSAARSGQSVAEPAGGPPAARPAFRSPAGFTVAASGTDYQRGTFRQQLTGQLAVTARPAQALPATIAACVRHVTGGATPIFVDSARFDGQPATIIVVRNGTGEVAWAVSASCSSVLDTTTLPPGISAP